MSASWVWSDAWVFTSIGGTTPDDASTLEGIVATADYLNHAVLQEAEFVRAINRLVAAGLVGVSADRDRYWRTVAGARLHADRMRRHSPSRWDELLMPALRSLAEPLDGEWTLPPGLFDATVTEYLRGMQQKLDGSVS
jgi:hypothetical protein